MKKLMVLVWSIIMVFTLTACSVKFEVRNKRNNSSLSSKTIEINKSVAFEGESKIDIEIGCGKATLIGYEGNEIIISGTTNLSDEKIILTKEGNTIKIKDKSDNSIDLFGDNNYILDLEIKIPYSFNGDLHYEYGAGESETKAAKILDVGNACGEYLYIKHDGSLDDGMELVTHPMTLSFHQNEMPWAAILAKAKEMGYRSHQAGTCGLHVHLNRSALGKTEAEQDESIARILYFFEKHWEELLKFSRRTSRQLKQWANRYGLKDHPQEILNHAKGNQERYTCVNLTNYHTIEFRVFRGTLKLNSLTATLQLLDRICDVAICLSDEEIKDMSWTTFVAGCAHLPELVQYLKERRLYVNEPVAAEVEV